MGTLFIEASATEDLEKAAALFHNAIRIDSRHYNAL
jgi:hypothetical protein